jgi:hypothetical protein
MTSTRKRQPSSSPVTVQPSPVAFHRRPAIALYLPPWADRFASRQTHGLFYRSQRETPAARAARKARKLRAKLGEAPAVLNRVHFGTHSSAL